MCKTHVCWSLLKLPVLLERCFNVPCVTVGSVPCVKAYWSRVNTDLETFLHCAAAPCLKPGSNEAPIVVKKNMGLGGNKRKSMANTHSNSIVLLCASQHVAIAFEARRNFWVLRYVTHVPQDFIAVEYYCGTWSRNCYSWKLDQFEKNIEKWYPPNWLSWLISWLLCSFWSLIP